MTIDSFKFEQPTASNTEQEQRHLAESANLSFADVHNETPAKASQAKNDEAPLLEPVPKTAKDLAERIVLDVYSVLRTPDDKRDLAQLQQDAQAIMVKPEVPKFDGKVTDANEQFRTEVSKAMPDALKYRSSDDSITIDSTGRILASSDGNAVVRNGRDMFQTRQLSADAASPASVLDIGNPWAGPEQPSQLAEGIQKNVDKLLDSWNSTPGLDKKTAGAALIKELDLLAPRINSESGNDVDENADYRSAVRDELAKIEAKPQYVPLPNISINDRGDLESFNFSMGGRYDHAKLLQASPDSNPDMPPNRYNEPRVIDIGK